jgi:putative FmdB family regulatory protein
MYTFQCACGVRFEAHAAMKDHQQPKPCPDCGKAAPRVLPTEVNGVFNQQVTGPVPQNTGISALDVHIDRVIGQSSKQGWDYHERRARYKKSVLQNHPGKTPEDLSRNPDGSYRVLQPAERAVHERANEINHQALTTLKPPKKPAPAPR